MYIEPALKEKRTSAPFWLEYIEFCSRYRELKQEVNERQGAKKHDKQH